MQAEGQRFESAKLHHFSHMKEQVSYKSFNFYWIYTDVLHRKGVGIRPRSFSTVPDTYYGFWIKTVYFIEDALNEIYVRLLHLTFSQVFGYIFYSKDIVWQMLMTVFIKARLV